MSNDEPPRDGDRPGGRRRRRAGRPKEEPRPGDLKPQPQDRWGELYCVYKLYDRHGTLLYVGVTDDVVRQLTEHQRGTRLQWGGRLDDRSRWWAEVVHVTVEHLPAGTTEWEARLYARTQLALGPLYNDEADGGAEPARAARLEAEQRDAERHDRARQLHARHDGVTRLVRPTLSIVPRFPNSQAPAPGREPAPEPAAVVGAHDARRLQPADPGPGPGPGPDPDHGHGHGHGHGEDADPDQRREPALAGIRSGRPGPAEPGGVGAPVPSPTGPPVFTAVGGAQAAQGSVATATRPAPAGPAPSDMAHPGPEPHDDAADRSLEHQGRYLLLTMAGVLLGIVLLSLEQVLH